MADKEMAPARQSTPLLTRVEADKRAKTYKSMITVYCVGFVFISLLFVVLFLVARASAFSFSPLGATAALLLPVFGLACIAGYCLSRRVRTDEQETDLWTAGGVSLLTWLALLIAMPFFYSLVSWYFTMQPTLVNAVKDVQVSSQQAFSAPALLSFAAGVKISTLTSLRGASPNGNFCAAALVNASAPAEATRFWATADGCCDDGQWNCWQGWHFKHGLHGMLFDYQQQQWKEVLPTAATAVQGDPVLVFLVQQPRDAVDTARDGAIVLASLVAVLWCVLPMAIAAALSLVCRD
eukprot:PLAT3363.1.p1 GENE.PLAT3363.1~~PLAT3363.1.p1  ORF type:complete len:294 (+),score=62.02 PLAT3363.1:1-882(+)